MVSISLMLCVSAMADSFHVPTPEAAKKLLGLRIEMFPGDLNEESSVSLVKVQFSGDMCDADRSEVIVRNGVAETVVFTGEIRLRKSQRQGAGDYVGFEFSLATEVLPLTYLHFLGKRTGHDFYVPLLRFTPHGLIEDKERQAGADYRDQESVLIVRGWPAAIVDELVRRTADSSGLRTTLEEALKGRGVRFSAGSHVVSGRVSDQVFVRNTEDNLQKIDQVLKGP